MFSIFFHPCSGKFFPYHSSHPSPQNCATGSGLPSSAKHLKRSQLRLGGISLTCTVLLQPILAPSLPVIFLLVVTWEDFMIVCSVLIVYYYQGYYMLASHSAKALAVEKIMCLISSALAFVNTCFSRWISKLAFICMITGRYLLNNAQREGVSARKNQEFLSWKQSSLNASSFRKDLCPREWLCQVKRLLLDSRGCVI